MGASSTLARRRTSQLLGFLVAGGCVLGASSWVGCKARPELGREAPAIAAASSEPPRAPSKTFGAPLAPGPELALADVLKAPERYRDQAITIEGRVRSACTRRGCWMEVAETLDPAAPGCRVTFKDYGFFVPTDSAGTHAKVQGTFGVSTLPPERVAHLESEGGQFPRKNPDGSVDELRLVASGVELWR